MKKVFLKCFIWFKVDVIVGKFISLCEMAKIYRYERICRCKINYVSQGNGGLILGGDITKFKIHNTSHLKSGTFIECSGGVTIGRYFHVGRNLTIFSTSHNYRDAAMLPYDEKIIEGSVTIGDFVWCGANVTILPGVIIGQGAVIGAGAIVTKDIPDGAIVAGNPAQIIKYRDFEHFNRLNELKQWY